MAKEDESYKGLKLNQVEGLEDAYKTIKSLEEEVRKLKENMVSREELEEGIKAFTKTFKEALSEKGNVTFEEDPDPKKNW